MNRKREAEIEKWQTRETEELFRAVLALRNGSEARRFFRDLLTENEIVEFSRRWQAARLLDQKVPYTEIGRRTWLTPRTIARIQKWLKDGMGGYRLMIDRVQASTRLSSGHHPISSGKRSAALS